MASGHMSEHILYNGKARLDSQVIHYLHLITCIPPTLWHVYKSAWMFEIGPNHLS